MQSESSDSFTEYLPQFDYCDVYTNVYLGTVLYTSKLKLNTQSISCQYKDLGRYY